MDPVLLLGVGLAIVGLTALVVAIRRGRTLDRIGRMAARGPHPVPGPPGSPLWTPASVEDAVETLRDRSRSAETRLDEILRDRAGLLDVVAVGVVHLDDRLRIDVANVAAHHQLARSPGTLVGMAAIEAFIDTAIETVAIAARTTGVANGEMTVRREGGPTLVIRAWRSAVRGVWLTMEDVSELRRLQRIRAEFIDNLSHELRTPLTTVSLLAETLVREAEEAGESIPPRMRDRIAKIEVETDHLAQMVSELLDLSRIESGGPIRLLDMIDLARLATATTERLRLFAERQGVILVTDADRPVAPINGAEDRLGQALVNLLHNAVKFSPDGGVVRVSVTTAGGDVVVAVEDHGIGIAAADQARIFERFYKADKARRRGAGTGLGLAIVRHVVEAHGGWITVESAEGAGSTFRFGIPAAVDNGGGVPVDGPEARPARPATSERTIGREVS